MAARKRSDAQSASRLGKLITPDFVTALKEGKFEERDEAEHKHLSELLSGVLFQAQDGSWHKSTALLVASDVQAHPRNRFLYPTKQPKLQPGRQGSKLCATGPRLVSLQQGRPRTFLFCWWLLCNNDLETGIEGHQDIG